MTALQFPVIDALVIRHAEDAAFYWSQLDGAIKSPTLRVDRLRHFNNLLDAHLDGLLVAGPQGWKRALGALARWKKPGEAFTCTWIAAQRNDAELLDEVLALVRTNPQNVLRGVVSALAWLPKRCSTSALERWGSPDADSAAQVAALRAAALIGPDAISALRAPLPHFLASSDKHVRGAACRAAALRVDTATDAALRDCLTDPELTVRAEAAIALGNHNGSDHPRQVLLRCVIDQAAIHSDATGWNRTQATRRLERWVRELAWLMPFEATDSRAVLAILPPRSALMFALAHGDPAHLPFVSQQADEAAVARYAGWVWQSLTGIDLSAAGWALAEPPPTSLGRDQLITEASLDADNGLPVPDGGALRAHLKSNPEMLSQQAPILLGRHLDKEFALHVLRSAPQALRFLAARTLGDIAEPVDVRAPMHLQDAAFQRVQAMTLR